MRKRQPEQDFQRSLIQWLRAVLPRDALAYANPNGGLRSKAEAAIFKGLGVLAGIPDITVIYKGRAYYLECKIKGTYLSPAQHTTIAMLQSAGSPTAVVRAIEDAELALAEWKIPLRIKLTRVPNAPKVTYSGDGAEG